MSIRSPEIDGKVIVAVGVLVLFVVAGAAGTATATTTNIGVSIDQTEGESVEIAIVDPGLLEGSLSVVGGLVGYNEGGTIDESYATGSIEGSGDRVSGIVGENNVETVTDSYSTGSVEGDEAVGGLVGKNAERSNISESYAAGSVEGNKRTGGLVGVNNGTVTNSYWDTGAAGQSTSAGNGTGLTTVEMTGSSARNNMRGFDFTDTWETVGGDYPILSWQRDSNRGNASSGSNSTVGSQGIPSTSPTAVLALLTVVAAIIRRRWT